MSVTLTKRKCPMTRLDKDLNTPFEPVDKSLRETALLSTSRQIRIEALPLNIQRTTFGFTFNKRIRSDRSLAIVKRDLSMTKRDPWRRPFPTTAERASTINSWASTLKPDSLRLLRKASMQLPLLRVCSKEGTDDMLHFSLTPHNGRLELSVEDHAWLEPDAQQLLRDHTTATNELAKSLKVEGEALIMVLTSRPDIWNQLELTEE